MGLGTGFNDDGFFINDKKLSVDGDGRIVFEETNQLAYLSEVASISANLQSQIDSISASGTDTSGAVYQGVVDCNTSDFIYTVNHEEVNVNYFHPQVSLVVPSSASFLYSQAISNRTSTSFDVILSSAPESVGFKINWLIVASEDANLGDLVVSPLEISSISGSNEVYNQIENVEAIRFDADSGFDVIDLGSGAVKIQMNSTFKYWEVAGQDTVTAEGLDTIELIAGNGLEILTNSSSPKSVTFNVTGATGGSGGTQITSNGSNVSTMELSGGIPNSLVPDTSGAYDLGSEDLAWRNAYVTDTLKLGAGSARLHSFSRNGVTGNGQVVDIFPTSLGGGAHWYIKIQSGSNLRMSDLMVVWDGTSTISLLSETSTADIGDTTPVTFSRDISGSDVRLLVDTDGNDWDFEVLRTVL